MPGNIVTHAWEMDTQVIHILQPTARAAFNAARQVEAVEIPEENKAEIMTLVQLALGFSDSNMASHESHGDAAALYTNTTVVQLARAFAEGEQHIRDTMGSGRTLGYWANLREAVAGALHESQPEIPLNALTGEERGIQR